VLFTRRYFRKMYEGDGPMFLLAVCTFDVVHGVALATIGRSVVYDENCKFVTYCLCLPTTDENTVGRFRRRNKLGKCLVVFSIFPLRVICGTALYGAHAYKRRTNFEKRDDTSPGTIKLLLIYLPFSKRILGTRELIIASYFLAGWLRNCRRY